MRINRKGKLKVGSGVLISFMEQDTDEITDPIFQHVQAIGGR
jgi:hypothetical protein